MRFDDIIEEDKKDGFRWRPAGAAFNGWQRFMLMFDVRFPPDKHLRIHKMAGGRNFRKDRVRDIMVSILYWRLPSTSEHVPP